MNQKGFSNIVLVVVIVAIIVVGGYFVLVRRGVSKNYITYAECVEKTELPCKHYFVGDFDQEWRPSPYRSKEECDNVERPVGSTCVIPPGEFRENRWINSVDLERAEREKTASNQNPTPTPKDETVSWKTYTNTKYGYEFKYPPTGVQDPISFENSGNPVAFSSNDFEVDSTTGAVKSGFDINIEFNASQTFGQGNAGLPGTVDRKLSTFLGNTANIITLSNFQGNYYGYEILRATKPMYIYVRYGSNGDSVLNIFNQILSTFKFN